MRAEAMTHYAGWCFIVTGAWLVTWCVVGVVAGVMRRR